MKNDAPRSAWFWLKETIVLEPLRQVVVMRMAIVSREVEVEI
jgi:hypothetical protein